MHTSFLSLAVFQLSLPPRRSLSLPPRSLSFADASAAQGYGQSDWTPLTENGNVSGASTVAILFLIILLNGCLAEG